MTRTLTVLAIASLATACGGSAGAGKSSTGDSSFPPLSTASAGATLTASGADPAADTGDPRVDIVKASIRLDDGTLTATIDVAAPPTLAKAVSGDQVVVGAYLLRGQDDPAPDAVRMVVSAGGQPRFLFGPWLAAGSPVTGSVTGSAVTLTVPHAATYRYVTFYGESSSSDDVLPDADPSTSGVIALN